MIPTAVQRWLGNMWRFDQDPGEAVQRRRIAIQATFSSVHGQEVLQWLLDRCYCTISVSSDPNDVIAHNAQRALVHEILEELDAAQHPTKYNPQQEDAG